jgi:hypothetical protein
MITLRLAFCPRLSQLADRAPTKQPVITALDSARRVA